MTDKELELVEKIRGALRWFNVRVECDGVPRVRFYQTTKPKMIYYASNLEEAHVFADAYMMGFNAAREVANATN